MRCLLVYLGFTYNCKPSLARSNLLLLSLLLLLDPWNEITLGWAEVSPLSIIQKSISFTGLIIDRPKIKVLSYRLHNSNPNSITEESSCEAKQGIGTAAGVPVNVKSCDELITVTDAKQLGQDSDEVKEWSIPPNVTQLSIQCSSKSGPIEWDYQGKGKFPDIEIENRRITGDFWTPTTYIHNSELTFYKVDDQLTGTFVCRSIEKPSISNSFYMFVPQEKRPILDFDEEPFVVTPSSAHAKSVIIPCRVKERESSIHLYKKMENGSLKRMNMDSSLSLKFNPYIGFELELSPEVYGHYVCKIDKQKKQGGHDEEESQFRKLSRRKRHFEPETSTSPGFSAFPTSEELAAGSLAMPDQIYNPSSQENPDEISITYPDSELTNRKRLRLWRRWGLNKNKKPVFLRRRVSSSHFSRRGGPHYHGHHGPSYQRLRPKPLMGPFRRPPQQYPHFHPHPNFRPNHHHIKPLVIPLPMSIVHESAERNTTHKNNETISSEQAFPVSSSEIPGKDYFWPPLQPLKAHHHEVIPSFSPSPYPNRIKILPTLIENVNKLGQRLRPTIRPFAATSSEETSSESDLRQKEKEYLSSSEDSYNTAYQHQRRNNSGKKPPRRGAAGAIISQNLLPQTMNIMNSMGCVLKKVMLGPDASCNGSFFEAGTAALSRHPTGGMGIISQPQTTLLGERPEHQVTILEVIVQPLPANKFFPPDPILYTTVPFFVKWQTKSTDYSNWAEINHTLVQGTYKLHKAGTLQDHGIHSFEVFNLRDGDSGKIAVPYVGSNNKIMNHTWKFFVINSTTASEKGIKQREEGSKHIFVCKSATGNKPKITLTKLTDDGCPFEESNDVEKRRKGSKRKSLVEEDCGVDGCVSIRTDIESGVVHCVGDGVDESIRYPVDVHCSGRPFFVERGKTKNLTLSQNKKKLNIPCVINNPNADVYLFHQNPNGTISDVTDYTSYDLKLGFSLNLEEIPEPLGTYACTSSVNVEDDSDMVTYHVNPAPSHVFNPPHPTVYGTPPFRFVWESIEELEVENKSAGNFYSGVFAKPEGNRAYVGTFEIATLDRGSSGVVNVVRSKDKQLVHSWSYAYQGKYGLWVDKKLNIFKCTSSTSKTAPSLFAVECSNPNVCKIKKRFIEGDNEDKKDPHRHRDNNLINVPVECGKSCRELKIWKDKPHGFVKCVDKGEEFEQLQQDGSRMEESLTYFLSRNSTILTESDDLEPFKAIDISSVVRQLRLGDRITFVCRANKYFYSKGFQWAIEMKNGSKRFLDPSISQEKDGSSIIISSSGMDFSSAHASPETELRAEVHLTVGDKDWKAVWCYAPSIMSNGWGNASQLVYIH